MTGLGNNDGVSISKRCHWLDIARFVCAFLIVMVHMPVPVMGFLTGSMFCSARVPLFFVISGYFFARKVSASDTPVREGLTRAWHLFVPFVFCSLVCYFIGRQMGSFHDFDFLSGTFFIEFFGLERAPLVPPFWFLRDLFVLYIITSFIIRLRLNYLIPASLALLSVSTAMAYSLGWEVLMPETAGFYMLGVCFGKMKGVLETAEQLARKASWPFVIIFIAFNICSTTVTGLHLSYFPESWSYWIYISAISRFFGACTIIILCVKMEDRWPSLGLWSSKWASATFFIFAFHHLTYAIGSRILDSWGFSLAGIIDGWLDNSLLQNFLISIFGAGNQLVEGFGKLVAGTVSLFIAVPAVFALLTICFMLIKKYMPFLLPFVSVRGKKRSPKNVTAPH